MSEHEVEAIIWCPGCKFDLWRLPRRPLSQEGHNEYHPAALTDAAANHGYPEFCPGCGGKLERKP